MNKEQKRKERMQKWQFFKYGSVFNKLLIKKSVITHTSYSEAPGFKSRSGRAAILTKIFRYFPRPTKLKS
jgi:hypothetical protein